MSFRNEQNKGRSKKLAEKKYITLALAQREMHIALIKMDIAVMVRDG